jgi:hypothetical protein
LPIVNLFASESEPAAAQRERDKITRNMKKIPVWLARWGETLKTYDGNAEARRKTSLT